MTRERGAPGRLAPESGKPPRRRKAAGRAVRVRAAQAMAGAGPGPADAVLVGELTDLPGDPGLVRLRGVGAVAVQVEVAAHQAGMMGAQPAEVPFPGTRAQVQHDGIT